jgi:hypothetical protein
MEKTMKTIFAFILFLAFVAPAPAGLQFMVNDGPVYNGQWIAAFQTAEFSIVNQTQQTGIFEGGFVALHSDRDVKITRWETYPQRLPGTWSILDLGEIDLGNGLARTLFISWDVPAIDPFKIGKLVSVVISGPLFTGPTLRYYNYNAEPVLAVRFFPEPASLSLLGLGAMMLRRKHSA